jgi:hypothetical protein
MDPATTIDANQAQNTAHTEVSSLASWLTFQHIADSSSILGFLLTLWVLWTVRKISRYYFSKGRLPSYRKQLEDSASDLSSALGHTPRDSRAIDAALATLKAHASSTKKWVPWGLRRDLKMLVNAVEAVQNENHGNDSKLWEIYSKTLSCSTALKNHLADKDWRGP